MSDLKSISEFQELIKKWNDHNFPETELWHKVLGLSEEVGELSHAVLKRDQGIRKDRDYDSEIKDAVGDIFLFLAGFCTIEGISMQECVELAWDEIKDRDWKKYPSDGKSK